MPSEPPVLPSLDSLSLSSLASLMQPGLVAEEVPGKQT